MQKLEISIDWLSITFPAKAMSDESIMAMARISLGIRMPKLRFEADHGFDGICIDTTLLCDIKGKGFMGFSNSADLFYTSEGERIVIGILAWGGKSQRDRAYVSLSGIGAQLLDHSQVASLLQELKGRITRIDIALDDHDGRYPVSKAVAAYRRGAFNTSAGRPPAAKHIDDLGNKTGCTLYVGKRESGKMLRVYEKGLQLNPGSKNKWVRYEVELHNTDREIPEDIAETLVEHFLGSYHFLAMTFAKPLQSRSKSISCNRKSAELVALRMIEQFKNQNGRFLNLIRHLGVSANVFVEYLRREGLPKRLKHMEYNDVKLAFKLHHTGETLIEASNV